MITMLGNQPATNCKRCGRRLSSPESVQRGVGPVCWGKGHRLNPVEEHEAQFADLLLLVPVKDNIVLHRDSQRVYTNVPHLVTHHSPSGFEFGYGGSGPADLALNIVELILRTNNFTGETMECWDGNECFQTAWRLHQDFKSTFISAVPRDGATIPYDMAEEWVLERALGH